MCILIFPEIKFSKFLKKKKKRSLTHYVQMKEAENGAGQLYLIFQIE